MGKGKNRKVMFTCVVKGTMCSGKNDTSTMNSIRQHCNASYLLQHIRTERPEFNFDFMVAGDDMLICIERSDKDLF